MAEPAARQAKPPRAVWRRVVSWFTTLVVLALLGLAVPLAVIPALHGGKALTVLTGSMRPTINPGDVAVVYPVESFDDVRVGDVVTFMPNPEDPTLVTHRVIGWAVNGAGETTMITQGDNNNAPDEPIMEKQIRAKVAYTVPWVGNVLQYGNEFGKPILVVGVAIGLIVYAVYAMVTSMVRGRRNEKAARRHRANGTAATPAVAAGLAAADAEAGRTEELARVDGPGRPAGDQANPHRPNPVGVPWRPVPAKPFELAQTG
jgi:signal peptidase